MRHEFLRVRIRFQMHYSCKLYIINSYSHESAVSHRDWLGLSVWPLSQYSVRISDFPRQRERERKRRKKSNSFPSPFGVSPSFPLWHIWPLHRSFRPSLPSISGVSFPSRWLADPCHIAAIKWPRIQGNTLGLSLWIFSSYLLQ